MFDETFKSRVEVGQFFFMQDCLAYNMTSRIYDLCSLYVSRRISMFSLQNKFSDASWGGVAPVWKHALHQIVRQSHQ